MESKALLDLCRKHGIDVKNQLSTLTPEQRDAIVALVRKGSGATVPQPVVPTVLPPRNVPNLTSARPPVITSRPVARQPEAVHPDDRAAGGRRSCPGDTDSCRIHRPADRSDRRRPGTADARTHLRAARRADRPSSADRIAGDGQGRREAPPERAPAPSGAAHRRRTGCAADAGTVVRPAACRPARRFGLPLFRRPAAARRCATWGGNAAASGRTGRAPTRRPRPQPHSRRGPCRSRAWRLPRRRAAAAQDAQAAGEGQGTAAGLRPAAKIAEIPPELLNREGPARTFEEIQRAINQPAAAGRPASSGAPASPRRSSTMRRAATRRRAAPAAPRPGRVVGSDARHNQRNIRQAERKSKAENDIRSGRVGLLTDDDAARPRQEAEEEGPRPDPAAQGQGADRGADHRALALRGHRQAQGRRCSCKLMSHGAASTITINSSLEPDLAETMALEVGCELEIKRPADAEEAAAWPRPRSRTTPKTSCRGRRSSPSWATSITARPRCWTRSARATWPPPRPAASRR